MTDAPTLVQVAAEAGVSPATASRVLTGSARVATSTRRRVNDAVARLGYVRRRAVYTLSGQSSGRVVAAVVCEPLRKVMADPFHTRLLTAAEGVLTAHGVSLVVLASPGRESVPLLRTGAFGGVLLVGAADQHPVAVAIAASGVPVRCAGRPPAGTELPYVDVDNPDGARQAAEHLIFSNRRRIGVIAGPRTLPAARDRLGGFMRTLEDAGVASVSVAGGDFTYASGAHAARWLLERAPNLDAVFAVADTMAAGAVHTLRRTGRKVPQDVAVIGFDDAPFAERMHPALTTVRQPVAELAARAASMLLADMAEADSTETNPLLPTELIVRESA